MLCFSYKEKDYLKDTGLDGNVLLKLILWGLVGKMWTEFIWLTMAGDRFLQRL
jgi:hypothetical protein